MQKLVEQIMAAWRLFKSTAHGAAATLGASAKLIIARAMGLETFIRQRYTVECINPDGTHAWTAHVDNLVVDVGLNDILDMYYDLGTAPQRNVGLTDSTPTVAPGDTMASHPGWVEVTAYSEANRPNLTMNVAASGGSKDNSATKASFTINADSTVIGGAFVVDDATKGGAVGLLTGAGAFTSGDETANTGSQLNVTVTATMSSS